MLLSNELAKRGIETHIILHNAEGEFLAELDPKVRIHDIGLEAHGLLPLIALRLDALLGSFDDGLVIVKLWSSLLAIQPAALRRRRLLFAICEDLDPMEHWRRIKLGKVKKALVRPIFRYSPIVTANTERVADRMVEAYALARRPKIVYGGIDVTRIRDLARAGVQLTTSRLALRVVTVASVTLRKGHLRILAALSLIDTPWEWHIVGDGPEMSAIKDGISSKIAAQIYFHGAVANPYPYIANADVLVHLPYSEAWGIVILEALALGKPVVSSPCIGPTEIASKLDPRHQYIHFVNPESSTEVASAIVNKAQEASTIPSDIVSSFDISATADSWLSLADDAARQRSTPS